MDDAPLEVVTSREGDLLLDDHDLWLSAAIDVVVGQGSLRAAELLVLARPQIVSRAPGARLRP